MLASETKQQPLGSSRFEGHNSSPGSSPAAKLIEVGRVLACAECAAPTAGQCSYCRNYRNAYDSTAQFPNLFCGEQCEQEFVCAALASLTVEDCIRIQGRLEILLMGGEISDT